VVAEGKALRSPLEAVTDTEGRVRFDRLPAGSYGISVAKDGFEPWQGTVTVAGKPIDLAVSLKLKVLTEAVSVSGQRSPLANSDPNYIALRGGKLTNVYRVDNLVLTRDVGTFTFRSGSFSFLPPVLGRVATGVFVGDGNFQLKPVSGIAVKHLRFIAGVDSVDEDFTAMVVYFTDSTFDEIKQRSELAGESPAPHEEAFQRVKKVLQHRRQPSVIALYNPDVSAGLTALERLLNYEDIANYEAEILAELYNPAQRGSFRAFLHGRKNPDLRFLLNPRGALPSLPAPEETALLNFDSTSFTDGVWYLSHLASEVKSGRASSGEDKRLIAPEHYRIQTFIGRPNLLGKQPDLLATCGLRFRSLDDGTRMLKFELFPDLQMSRVAWNGKEIPFVQESRGKDGSFYLQMPEPLVKGQTYQVTFEYSGGEILQASFGAVPPRRIWYPMPAGPASRATYDLTFRAPRGMTIVSVGKQVNQTRDGDFDVTEWTSDVPITQAVFRYLADYSAKSTTDQTTKMDLAAYMVLRCPVCPTSSDVLTAAGNSVRIFTDWFGAPSYSHLSVVVGWAVDSLPGLICSFPPFCVTGACPGAVGPRLSTAYIESLPFQVSGQWWGNTVNPASFHDEWLSSGFANFSASLYDLAANLNPGDFRNHWLRARDSLLHPPPEHPHLGQPCRYCSPVRPNDTGPLWMGALNETNKTPGAAYMVRTFKGGYVLHMLRSLMRDPQTGDADFRAMMRDFVKQFTNRAVSTEDFKSLVEKHMKPGMDVDGNHRMDWFFNDWVYGTDIPSYRLEYSLTPGKNGKQSLAGKLTQSGVSPEFKMVVPVFAEFADKKMHLGAAAIHGNSTVDFKVILPARPRRVLLNLNHDVLTDKEEVTLMK
jgi:hypothetical protein